MTPPPGGSTVAGPASKPGGRDIQDRIGAISERNRAAVMKFLRDQRASGLKPKTVKNYFDALRSFDGLAGGRPLHRATPADVVRWVERMRDGGMGEGTIRLYKFMLGAYMKRTNGGDLAREMEAALRHAKPRRRLPADALVTRDEVRAAVGAARTQRDRALLSLGYEGGFRLGELRALNVGSVVFDESGGADVTIPERSGQGGVKTGGRTVWVFDSAPDLRLWLNQHPSRDDPDAPLWTGPGGNRLSETQMRTNIRSLFERAGVRKRVWPHLLRHSRLTELAASIAESDLRLMAGWTPGSDMVATYVNRTAADLKRKLKRLRGVATEEERAREDRNPLAPVKCPDLTCGTLNPPGSIYCNRCAGPLTAEVARHVKEVMAERRAIAGRVVRSDRPLTIEELKAQVRMQVLEEVRKELVGRT